MSASDSVAKLPSPDVGISLGCPKRVRITDTSALLVSRCGFLAASATEFDTSIGGLGFNDADEFARQPVSDEFNDDMRGHRRDGLARLAINCSPSPSP